MSADITPCKNNNKHAFTTATGDPFGSEGEFKVPFQTQEGHNRVITFQNAPVTVPIISASRICNEDASVTYETWGGAGLLTTSLGRKANSYVHMVFTG